MRRILILMIAGVLAALALWYGLSIYKQTPSPAVSALLPRETIFFAHIPDFNRTRDQWHHADIYQLCHEAAVQDFLRKTLARLPKKDATSETLGEINQLDPKDSFFALISIDNNNPVFVAGFRFRGTQDEAERIVGKWRAKWLQNNPSTKQEKIAYQQHQIETIAAVPFTLATAYDGHWFFLANDLTELKSLLDRADHRTKDRQSTLEIDQSYRAAMVHMPSSYAMLSYLQPKKVTEKINSLRASLSQRISADQRTLLEQMRSICDAIRFENGKIREVTFVGLPNLEQAAALDRSSLTLGTKDTFFYLAMLLDIGQKIDTINQTAGIGGRLQKLFQAFSANGVTADDWKRAFGMELGLLADWPANAHWPSLLLTLPVKDSGKAQKIVDALAKADQQTVWTQTEKDGVRYFSLQSSASFLAIMPEIALSDRILVAGIDPASVEAAMQHEGNSNSQLLKSPVYKTAARSAPAPTNMFTYVDTALLYERVDTTLRPMLLMSAAFIPAINDYVDVNKLPAPEVVTRHLSPIVASQRYDRDGYVAESVGPVSLNQATVGFGLAAVFWAISRHQPHR